MRTVSIAALLGPLLVTGWAFLRWMDNGRWGALAGCGLGRP